MILVHDIIIPEEVSSGDNYEYRDRATLHCMPWVDGAGNQFDCFSTLQGNTTAIIVIKSDRDGRELQRWTLPALANFKIDDFGVFQAGADLIFLVAAHEISSAPDRRNIVYRDQLPDVAIPYAAGVMPVGAATRYIGNEPDPPAEVDYSRIARDVVTAIKADMAGELGGLIQQRAKNGTRQGLQTEGALTLANVYDSTGLYNRVKETAYESCMNAIKDSKGGAG